MISKFHNDWIKIQGGIASYKNVPRIISLKFRCKINIFGHSPSIITQGNKLAESISNKRSVDFWNEIKKIKGTHEAMPGMVDGAQTEEKISQIFSRKYDCLYNSVSYDETDMSQDDISKSVSSHLHDSGSDCICKSGVTINLVEQAIAKIKFGKTDASNGCTKKTEYIFFIIIYNSRKQTKVIEWQ